MPRLNAIVLRFPVEVSIKNRKVVVKGPRGTLRRSFHHLAVDIRKTGKDKIIVEKWFGIKQELAAVRTVCSHIENMFKGVVKVRLGAGVWCTSAGIILCMHPVSETWRYGAISHWLGAYTSLQNKI